MSDMRSWNPARLSGHDRQLPEPRIFPQDFAANLDHQFSYVDPEILTDVAPSGGRSFGAADRMSYHGGHNIHYSRRNADVVDDFSHSLSGQRPPLQPYTQTNQRVSLPLNPLHATSHQGVNNMSLNSGYFSQPAVRSNNPTNQFGHGLVEGNTSGGQYLAGQPLTSNRHGRAEARYSHPSSTFLRNVSHGKSPKTPTPPKQNDARGASSILGSSSELASSSPALQSSRRMQARLNQKHDTRFARTLASTPQEDEVVLSQLALPHAPPMAHGIPLVSPGQALPDRFKIIFPYNMFNAVQSKCFESVYGSNDNFVVSAPTGCGKTVILELAICRLMTQSSHANFKIVYQAPTKALCSERARDWEKKFGHLDLACAELTGDTSSAEMQRVGNASIIVTTPEKWDSITRKWQDHQKLVQMVKLFLIDEVHILKDVRGATLEAVVSRMKSMGSNVRFVALSATVPNSEDVAQWLGRDQTHQHQPARRETFGEEFRPVKLKKDVQGFTSNGNDFVFDKFLDNMLVLALAKHPFHKPILVFCFTKKSCESTAAKLAEHYLSLPNREKPWASPSNRIPVVDRNLQKWLQFGVAFHHAGLDQQDRAAVEQNFLSGDIGVICCTSTLAVGINLPCHTVVLKGTVGYQDGELKEYSDLEVMQMLGRAGRPQFDNSAQAIILTRSINKVRYEKMVSGQELLESTLHVNLIEHLNSEICLRTITNLASAKTWLSGTFLSVRMRKNPQRYHLADSMSPGRSMDKKIEEICGNVIKLLQEFSLATYASTFEPTDYGRAMAKYMVKFETMKTLMEVPRGVKLEQLLNTVVGAAEFNEFKMRANEKHVFREVNKSPLIRFPLTETICQTWHKISLLVQLHLGAAEYPDTTDKQNQHFQLLTEKRLIFDRLKRMLSCVTECLGTQNDSVGTKTALELTRSIAAEAWDGQPVQLVQVPQIGPVAMRRLVAGGVKTVQELAETHSVDIERHLNHNPPFGRKILDSLLDFPRLGLELALIGHKRSAYGGKDVLKVNMIATLKVANPKARLKWLGRVPNTTFVAETSDGVLAWFWRGSLSKVASGNGLELKITVELPSPDHKISCHFSCEDVVGTNVSETLVHNIPASAFPPPMAAFTSHMLHKSSSPQQVSEVDDAGIADDDLLEAANLLDAMSKVRAPPMAGRIERFPLIDELLDVTTPKCQAAADMPPAETPQEENKFETAQDLEIEPIQLANGRWQCNHHCTGDVLLKTGKPCTHKCCREGLDKPRKVKPKDKKRKSHNEDGDGDSGIQPAQTKHDGNGRGNINRKPKKRFGDHQVENNIRSDHSAQQQAAIKNNVDWWDFDLDDYNNDCVDLSHGGTEMYFGDRAPGPSNASMDVSMSNSDEQGLDEHVNAWEANSCGLQAIPNALLGTEKNNTVTNEPQAESIGCDDIYGDLNSIIEHEGADHEGYRLKTKLRQEPRGFKPGARDTMLFHGSADQLRDRLSPCSKALTVEHNFHTDHVNDAADNLADSSSFGLSAQALSGSDHSVMEGRSQSKAVPRPRPGQVDPPGACVEGAATIVERSEGVDQRRSSEAGVSEPSWVQEFDPELVNMFRGYVTFV